MTIYSEAPQVVVSLMRKVIDEHHDHLQHAIIGVIFRDTPAKSKGKTVLAKAKTIPAWLRAYSYFENMDFLIEIAEEIWRDLSRDQQEALIDHELCHCKIDMENERPFIVGHDIEEFKEVIDRHGFWNSDLLGATKTMERAIQSEFSGFRDAKINGEVVAVNPEQMPEKV